MFQHVGVLRIIANKENNTIFETTLSLCPCWCFDWRPLGLVGGGFGNPGSATLVIGSGVPEPIIARPGLLRSGCGGGAANATAVAAHLPAGCVGLGGGRSLGSSPPLLPALRQRWLLAGRSGLHGGTAAALAAACSDGGPHQGRLLSSSYDATQRQGVWTAAERRDFGSDSFQWYCGRSTHRAGAAMSVVSSVPSTLNS
jgi:hypothetical protein